MANELDIETAKLEFVRDVTVAYLNNAYPKPLSALSEDMRQKTIEQHRKEIIEFIKSMYKTVNEIIPPSKSAK